jgi:hypothetical protein
MLFLIAARDRVKGHFLGYFEGASTFLTPKLSLAGGVKKVLAPSKYPLKWPIK